MSVNVHCKYTNAGDSLGSAEGRAAGVYSLDGMSGSLQSVKIQHSDCVLTCTEHHTKPYQNVSVCATACLGLFSEVQAAGKYVKVYFVTTSTGWQHRRKIECSKWFSPACRMFGVRGYIRLRLWPESLTYQRHHLMCVTSFATAWRWTQETGSDEQCLHGWLQVSATDQIQQEHKYSSS